MRNSEGGLIELFARNARPGWDAWGNEITRAAANAIGWQCGEISVELWVNKDTTPYSYSVLFENIDSKEKEIDVRFSFKWLPDPRGETNGRAYLSGKRCKETNDVSTAGENIRQKR